jgi:hypothetical protein
MPVELDYLGWTTGSIAPPPEPSMTRLSVTAWIFPMLLRSWRRTRPKPMERG